MVEITINTLNEDSCDNCGEIVGSLYSVSNRFGIHEEWCNDCKRMFAEKCECCHEYVESSEVDEVVDGSGNSQLWCRDCIDNDNHVQYCDHCEHWTTSPLTHIDDVNEDWCEDCRDYDSTQCDDCCEWCTDESIHSYSVYSDGDVVEMNLCESCVEDYYECAHCHCLVSSADNVGNSWTPLCPNCDVVEEWGHTDGTFFWRDDLEYTTYPNDDELFVGIELETSDNDDIVALANAVIGDYGYERFACKKDSSLGDDGLEIVSQPMTPLYHLNSGVWEGVIEHVHEQGGLSYDSGKCGLHMHVSRCFLAENAIYRIDRLFHRFRDEMICFSRRTNLEYCELDEDTLHDIPDVDDRINEWKYKKYNEDRYVAVNTENDATVELRLWRGTLNLETFRATVEMTAGLAYVCNAMTNEFADELDWEKLKLLIRYALEEHGIPHDDFDSYINRRGL